MAPQETMNVVAETRSTAPLRVMSTASTRRPDGSVTRRSARAFVQSVTFGRAAAGRTAITSASLFAWIRHTNELHVLQRRHPADAPGSITPRGSDEGCNP